MNAVLSPDALAAFDDALRRYGHPAAIADLDACAEKGTSRRRMLEALSSMCRDNAIGYLDCIMNRGGAGSVQEAGPTRSSTPDPDCPLIRALRLMGYGSNLFDTEPHHAVYVVQRLREWMGAFGRPILPKPLLLAEHEARVRSFRAEESRIKSKNLDSMVTTSESVRKDDRAGTGTGAHMSDRVDWSTLRPTTIRELRMFDSNVGAYLEGNLLVDPFTPMVGCTTILEDRNGDVVLVALYNFLPDGVSGSEADPVASAKIPKGCRLRIVEPFLKVFRDGSRGIRVDDPHEVTVVAEGSSSGKGADALEASRAAGNALFGKKRYHAAAEAYLEGLRRGGDIVPTILSNRAQAYIMRNEWAHALADAAASLTIRPGCNKTWARYRKARGELESDLSAEEADIERSRHILRALFLADDHRSDEVQDSGDDAVGLKSKGNEAFLNGDYHSAASLYSAALTVIGGTSRAVLSNWSLCCLHMGAFIDSLALATASLRISKDWKALHRLCKSLLLLGEPSLSLLVGRKWAPCSDKKAASGMNELLNAARTVEELLENWSIRDPRRLNEIPEMFLPYWHADIETFAAGEKGRGVRATSDVLPNQVILIDHPIASEN